MALTHANPMTRWRLALLCLSLWLGACSTTPVTRDGPAQTPVFPADRVLDPGVVYESDRIWDPFEGFNRRVYQFNYYFDRYLFLPGVNLYRRVTPRPLQKGVHNFFLNLSDVTTLFNSVLQLDLKKTLDTSTRLLVNSTVGLLGFIDLASDVPRKEEDFGQTLGYWGLGPGPYLVLPVLGPSSLRDAGGYSVDWSARWLAWQQSVDLELYQSWTRDTLWAIDQRAHIAFRYCETGSPFEYELVRTLYSTKRKLDIKR